MMAHRRQTREQRRVTVDASATTRVLCGSSNHTNHHNDGDTHHQNDGVSPRNFCPSSPTKVITET
jgi:hypothetical protein